MTTSSISIPTTRPTTPLDQIPPQSLEFRSKLRWRLRAKYERLRLWWLRHQRRSLFSSLTTSTALPAIPVIPHPTAPPPLAWPTTRSVTQPFPPLFGDDDITEKRLRAVTKPLEVIKGLRAGEFSHAYNRAHDSGVYPTMQDAVAAARDELLGNEDFIDPLTNGVLQKPFPELPAWHPASRATLKRIRLVKIPANEPPPPPPKSPKVPTWVEKVMIDEQETLPHRWRLI